MIFLTDSDLQTIIKDNHLIQVLDDDLEAKNEAEEMAIAEIRDYLSGSYNTAAIFNATGTARHKSIIRITIDIMLYHLHARIDPIAMPEIRRLRYEDAIKWLRDVRDGKMNVEGLPFIDDDGNGEPDAGLWRLNDNGRFNSDY